MVQNVTEGEWEDWVKFQAVETVEFYSGDDVLVDQES